jgi:hypothetical protein
VLGKVDQWLLVGMSQYQYGIEVLVLSGVGIESIGVDIALYIDFAFANYCRS